MMGHFTWEEDAARRELAPKRDPKQSDVDAVVSKIAISPKAIGSDSPEHRDRGNRKVATSGELVDWQGYYRDACRELDAEGKRQKREAETLAAWTEALDRDQKRLDEQKHALRLSWTVWAIAAVVMMLVGNGFLGR